MRRFVISIAAVLLASVLGPELLAADQPTDNGTGQSSGAIDAAQAASQVTGEERFLRENRQVGQMVGGMGQGIGNQREQTDLGQNGGMFGGQSQFNMSNPYNQALFNYGMMNSLSRQRQQLRVPLRLGFTPPAAPSTSPVAVARVQSRLAKIPQLQGIGSVAVQLDGRVAVLRGQVASERDRDLLTRLVLLEPGISDVRSDELKVATAPVSPAP